MNIFNNDEMMRDIRKLMFDFECPTCKKRWLTHWGNVFCEDGKFSREGRKLLKDYFDNISPLGLMCPCCAEKYMR